MCLSDSGSLLAYDLNGNTPSHHAAHDANAAE